jgi:hypothetical protein
MKLKRLLTWSVMLFGMASFAAAQNPFVGVWKLNQEKSHLAGDTMTFGPASGDAIELNAGGTAYSFRIDGKAYRMAAGDLAIWKQVDPSSWTAEYRKPDGKPLATDTLKLSDDGKTLTVVTTGTKPDGENFTDSAIYTRTAGASGLIGSWKSTKVQLSSPGELTIAAYGLSGLSIKIASLKASLLANFDGKDVAPVGPDIPSGLTIALMRIGPASFRMVQKVNGAVIYSAHYTVSADGKTMTEAGNSPGDSSQTSLWEKQ